jgi:hypothetical protein
MAHIAYGWPRVLATESCDDFVELHADGEYLVAVGPWTVQLWAAGQARVRLGGSELTPEEADSYGRHTHAVWCPDRRMLAALVRCVGGKGGSAPMHTAAQRVHHIYC